MPGTHNQNQIDEPTLETRLLVFRKSEIHGLGAFARVAIPAGTRVIEYCGERITKSESVLRCEQNNEYIFSLNEFEDLDGNQENNPARFINHSCQPNCEAELEAGRIWIISKSPIGAGQEITFNYGYDLEDYRQHPCHCGAARCVGFMVAEEFFDHVLKHATRPFEVS
jgi:SET domain-containing protein